MNSRIVKIIVILNCITVITFALIFFYRQHIITLRQKEMHKIGNSWEKLGWMTETNYVELRRIEDVSSKNRITNVDIKWMLKNLKKRPNEIVSARILGILQGVPNLTITQKDEIFVDTIPLLKDNSSLVRIYAATIQQTVNDHRAVPYLLPLLDDPDRKVKATAKSILKNFGYDNLHEQGK